MSLGVSLDSLNVDHHRSDGGRVRLPYVPVLAAGGEALCLLKEAVEPVKVRGPLRQKVIVGVTHFPPITNNGQDTGAFAGSVLPLCLDHFGCSIFRI